MARYDKHLADVIEMENRSPETRIARLQSAEDEFFSRADFRNMLAGFFSWQSLVIAGVLLAIMAWKCD